MTSFRQYTCLLISAVLLFACGTTNPVSKKFTEDDKKIFDLIDRLKKNPGDEEAKKSLPALYNATVDLRKSITVSDNSGAQSADRFLAQAHEWEVMKQLYDAIVITPAAHKLIPDPWDPSSQIQQAYNNAAESYYQQGLVYLNANTRPGAQQAYDYFVKADKIIPGYKDVRNQLADAKSRSLIKVLVNPVNYYNNNFGYWGFQNDWMQDQLVRDLNFRAYRDVKFYTDWQLRNEKITPDKIVDLNYTNINIGQVYTSYNNYKRSAQVKTGETKSNPPQPVYETVTATVYVTTRYLQSNANLQCRIYDVLTDRNSMYQNFPNTYTWRVETATYKGDSRALTPEDWAKINNPGFNNSPGRYDIADRLLHDSYNMLISRINSSVSF